MRLLFSLLVFLAITSCSKENYVATKVSHEPPVDTKSREIEYQTKMAYTFNNGDIVIDNLFESARLNGCTQVNDSSFTLTISPENFPINSSPWYAFRVVAKNNPILYLNIEYQKAKHRYPPKTSTNKTNWEAIPEDNLTLYPDETGLSIKQEIISDTTWISAQEIEDSQKVMDYWEDRIDAAGGQVKKIGESSGGLPLIMLDICDGPKKGKQIIVLMSRQHPPELSGYLAMKAFLNRVLRNDDLSNSFREQYRLLIFPLVNPDGVDQGHWRHNLGGVDLNRDWGIYNQKEVRTIADRMVFESKFYHSDIILGIDFHSTSRDVYYTNDVDPSSMIIGDFKDQWLDAISDLIPGDELNESPSGVYPGLTTKNWFYTQFKAEGITFEIADNKPRDQLAFKGEVAAKMMMLLLLDQ